MKLNLLKNKTIVDFDASCIAAVTPTEAVKNAFLLLSLIGGILIMLFSMTGCSDMPYTGSLMTPEDVVNQYLVSGEDSICLVNGVESSCLKLMRQQRGGADSNGPIIHIHPRRLIYTFYYEGKQIVHAEKVMDTTEIAEAVRDSIEDPVQPPVTASPLPILVINPSPPPPPPQVSNPPPPPVRSPPPGNNGGSNNGGNNGGGNQQPTNPPRTPTTLEAVSGGGQSGETGQHLTNPLIVRVLDQHGDTLSGVTVSFTVSPTSGVLNPTSATTGSNGETSTALQLGSTAGTYTVTASVSGITQRVRFTATATEPLRATTLEKVSGDSQSAEVDQHLASPLVVRVRDQNNDTLSGVTASFTVNPSSGVLSPTSAETDSNGEASTVLRLGGTAGTYTVTVSAAGITQHETFTATATEATPPPQARVATNFQKVSGDGQSAQTNQHLTNPLVVKVIDQENDPLSGVTVSFTVNPNDGVLGSASTTTGSNGEASTTLQLGSTAGTYTVTASAAGITGTLTFTATATQPPRPNTLEKVSGDNQSIEAYQYLVNPFVVRVLDQYGDELSDVPISFTVNPTSGTLIPASTTTDADGEASTLLRFSSTTGTYTVTASASGITQTVTFTATATVRPTDSDWAQRSHYYDADESRQGWLVHIYYPENYTGPRRTSDEETLSNGPDFRINGFLLILNTGVTLKNFIQTEGACWDPDKPCHIGTSDDPLNSTTYSVQIFLETTLDQTSFQVIWDRSAANWSDNSPPPDMTYNLMASKNLMSGQEGDDPDHTQQ